MGTLILGCNNTNQRGNRMAVRYIFPRDFFSTARSFVM